MINFLKLVFFFFLINISFISCEKEDQKKYVQVKYPPFVLTPYHISAYVDTDFIDGAWSYDNPDTIYSIYSTSSDYFLIQRSDTIGHGWKITGHYDLSILTYPITFWISNSSNMEIRADYYSLGFYHPHNLDSTLFSITLLNFDHDTLSGTFQGKLFVYYTTGGTPVGLDSIVTVTNGQFKIPINKFH
jgi:hypothetical protein